MSPLTVANGHPTCETTTPIVYKRCRHERSCTFKSPIGWCIDHCREYGCSTDGEHVHHDDRRGQRDDQPVIDLMKPSTRKPKR